MEIILAIIIGTALGFALNRVGATNPQNIINMLRLTDLSLMKTFLFAIAVSSLFLFLGLSFGIIDAGNLSIKTSYIGVLIGGGLLGLGFAISGYCPGTGLAAVGTGRKDALFFIVGGFLGAFAYMLSYEAVKSTGILESIFGGKAMLAVTENEKYVSLLNDLPAILVAGSIAFLLLVVVLLLPRKI